MITPIEDTELSNTDVICAIDGCCSEAAFVIDRSNTPLCSSCHEAFQWGVSNAEEKANDEIRGTKFEVINSYRKDFINGRAIAAIWHVDDVLNRANETDADLTEEQALEILSRVDRKYDANIGINWDVLDTYIELEAYSSGHGGEA